jgi:VIT1/CCC1 family predicted Fe2+/Mn2+ transporter
MGVGNLLAIRADERAREAASLPELEAYPWKHGLATTVAFVAAGAVPLLPYLMSGVESEAMASTILTFAMLFVLGASRSLVTVDRWWRAGLETLLLGAVVAVAAYGAGMIAGGFAA